MPLVNIAQPFKKSGMMLTCRAETGIKTPQDLKGRTLGSARRTFAAGTWSLRVAVTKNARRRVKRAKPFTVVVSGSDIPGPVEE